MSEPTKPVVNPTPKQILLADGKLLSMHRDLMQHPVLNRSLELALAHYQRILVERGAMDGFSASSNFYRVTGATEFIAILKSLGETQNIPKPSSTEQLNHKA